VRRPAVRLFCTFAFVYVAIVLVMMFLENQLIFPGPKYPVGEWEPRNIVVENVFFESEDGTRLHGWYLDHPEPLAYVLYCHGNGENIALLDWLLEELHD
jgi:hypothetical protein